MQCIQTIDAGGEVDSMLLSGKMLIVGLHVNAEEGMVRAWHIDTGTDVVLPGRHRVRPHSLPIVSTNTTASTPACNTCMCSRHRHYMACHASCCVKCAIHWHCPENMKAVKPVEHHTLLQSRRLHFATFAVPNCPNEVYNHSTHDIAGSLGAWVWAFCS